MSQNRFYSSVATKTSLNGAISNSATSITVNSLSGYPLSFPWTGILERDTANEEVVTVTAAAGLTLTVTRGVDGTSPVAHANGAIFEHGVSARDYNEPQVHMAASSGVHGLAGSVVGTTDTQTLTNKTLSSPAFTGTATGLTATAASLDGSSTIGGVSGTTLAADRTTWTSWTPTFGGVTGAAGTFLYKQIGKTVLVWGKFSAGTSNGATLSVTPPVNGTVIQSIWGNRGTQQSGGDFWTINGSTMTYSFLPTNGVGVSGYEFSGTYISV